MLEKNYQHHLTIPTKKPLKGNLNGSVKTYGFDWKNNLPIPSELPEQEWPINYDRNMQLLRCLVAIDESLGKLLATLEQMGELENTVVIYSSDNGYFMGEHTF